MRDDVTLLLLYDFGEELTIELSEELKLNFVFLYDLLNPGGFNIDRFVLIQLFSFRVVCVLLCEVDACGGL